jgi:hypothetical protein
MDVEPAHQPMGSPSQSRNSSRRLNGAFFWQDNTKPYRVVAISLCSNEADEADRVTEVLRRAGWPKANRSLVIREALFRLHDDLAGRSSEDIYRYFVERQAERARGKTNHS